MSVILSTSPNTRIAPRDSRLNTTLCVCGLGHLHLDGESIPQLLPAFGIHTSIISLRRFKRKRALHDLACPLRPTNTSAGWRAIQNAPYLFLHTNHKPAVIAYRMENETASMLGGIGPSQEAAPRYAGRITFWRPYCKADMISP